MLYDRSALAAVSIILAIVGCDRAKDRVEDLKTKVNNPEIQGTWVREKCLDTDYLGSPIKSVQTKYKFSGAAVTREEDFFSSSTCTDPAGVITYTGTFKVEKKLAEKSYQINMNFNKVMVNPKNETGRGVLNTLALCGEKNWAIEQSRNLTEASSKPLCPLIDLPVTLFDMYLVEGNTLYLGAGDNRQKVDEKDRPQQVDKQTRFLKK